MKEQKGKRKKLPQVAAAVPAAESSRNAAATEPPLGTAAATSETTTDDDGHRPPLQEDIRAATTTPKRTKSEAMREHWRKVRAGEVPDTHHRVQPPFRSVNPLFDLSEERRAKLLLWLRECPYDDAVQHMLRDQGIDDVTRAELDDFFEFEVEQHWEKRISRAAQEADALIKLVEKSPVKFSSGILAALGQEAFRQIASGQVNPDAMGKLATLFLRARSDERADQMQELKREKVRRELQDQIDQALEKLAEEVERHPEARKAFEALRKELETSMEEAI